MYESKTSEWMISTDKEPVVDLTLALSHGLTEKEYASIVSLLGRTPTYTELGIYSVMWSEHCSYKSSIVQLKKLPRSGKGLLVSAGEENAGLVDIGDGQAIAFKIESHNHPSAVEPYQGAATGVGGILRDIFTMGARPIAALNSLRFGSFDYERTVYLLKGVVKGIGDYGNSFGVPTVAGEVYFDPCYNENPLVNAMAVGIVKHEHVARAIATGEGNLVMIVGSSTGRDGIHGATFASVDLSEESEAKRPSVQVGDPFTEKLLLEATLEVIRNKLVVGIQDMGAAGITCSTSEMSAKGNSGMDIDLDRVPLREKGMTPYEIMLSESQERMLLVVEPRNEAQVREIFAKWDLPATVIGRVTTDGRLRVRMNRALVADVPAGSLVLGGGAPVYHLESRRPAYLDSTSQFDPESLPEPTDYTKVLLDLLSSPAIASKRWITQQYDSTVRTNTVCTTGDAAVMRIKHTRKGIALKTDGNARYVYLNPYRGAQIAVAESARNVACVGARPIAITNCLNFGNPNNPEMYWQFVEAVRGIADACRALETPVTGGNVSFYNENPEGAIYPTPVIGMLGIIDDIQSVMTAGFKRSGDRVVLLGETAGHLGGSEYLARIHGRVAGDAPPIDLQREGALQACCLDLIKDGIVSSVHDLSEGGLAVALAECAILCEDSLGADISVVTDLRTDAYLFGEDQSRIVISLPSKKMAEMNRICQKHGIEAEDIGEVTENIFRINGWIETEVGRMREAYESAISSQIG